MFIISIKHMNEYCSHLTEIFIESYTAILKLEKSFFKTASAIYNSTLLDSRSFSCLNSPFKCEWNYEINSLQLKTQNRQNGIGVILNAADSRKVRRLILPRSSLFFAFYLKKALPQGLFHEIFPKSLPHWPSFTTKSLGRKEEIVPKTLYELFPE